MCYSNRKQAGYVAYGVRQRPRPMPGGELMSARDAISDLIRENIDAIILCTLEDGDSYGYEILKHIATPSHGEYEMKEPSLYTSLKRLEGQGFVQSYWGDETQGARRKYYRVTQAGARELKEATERWVRVRDIIDHLLMQDGGDR